MRNTRLYVGVSIAIVAAVIASIPIAVCIGGLWLAGAWDTHDTEY